MRIVSLLPSATEIVHALGLGYQLVGVSHDCDFPPQVRNLPRVSACAIADPARSSAEVDRWVRERLAAGVPLYELDAAVLRALRPDWILTQDLCAVCAPDYGSVAALAAALPGPPRVLNLEASTLEGVLGTVTAVAAALGVAERGAEVVAGLRARIAAVARAVVQAPHRPRTAVLEWLDPLFCSGHWTPELVTLAGGEEVLGHPGAPSIVKQWDELAGARPEALVIACCGQSAERASQDWERIRQRPEVRDLPAVRARRVQLVDGNAYFNRPGPRLVDSLELLGRFLHPGYFSRREAHGMAVGADHVRSD
ncbi:MAG: hypothetical protein B7Z66_04880 [Chromatiales bacterium 21-64-14]|nr:MAG: hypothetical protein B7Z66_04880 [Chromatiales bacterium 21-64-14]HQU14663.1 ABC transporter substrate-binding protein [Gammaproteobacteria bacterium]